jgi:choline dehydrogenase
MPPPLQGANRVEDGDSSSGSPPTIVSAYDYIVVGGGSAGCAVARRLVEGTDARVLLLEAGPDDRHWTVRMPGAVKSHFEPASPFNWHLQSTSQPHLDGRLVPQPRGKGLGGSSSINAMVFLRGHPLDYERWSRQGATGWSYAEVLPYFKRLETYEPGEDAYRGGQGPVRVRRQEELGPLDQAFLRAGREAGHAATDDPNGRQQEGFCRFDMNVDGGVRASASHAYLHRGPPMPRLTVRTDALVHRILFDGRRAVGLEVFWRGSLERVRVDRELILSAGTFGSPRILMLSGVGPAEHLRALDVEVKLDLPGVGANLHDHPEIHLQHRCKLPITLNGHLRLDRKIRAGLEWFLFRTGVCARNHANTGAFLCSGQGVDHPDIQFHFAPYFYVRDRQVRTDEHGYLLDTGPMRPTSRGSLRLRSADPREPPLIDPNYLATEEDRRSMRDAVALARETLAQAAFAPFDAGEAVPGPAVRSRSEIDAFIRQYTVSAFHPVGTCKMGSEGDASAVVDPQGRVRGLEGLRVVDASIMPSLVSSNTNAPSMMIGEKLADAIAGKAPLAPIRVEFVPRTGGGRATGPAP